VIQIGSCLKISDNSGIKLAKCIKVISLSSSKKIGHIGDLILITIKKYVASNKIKKKMIYHGLIVMVKRYTRRNDGSFISCNNNRLIVFSKNEVNNKFIGSRVYGSIMKEVKFNIYKDKKEKQKYFKLLSYFKSLI
jgi:large subunit ribosomal protein L14